MNITTYRANRAGWKGTPQEIDILWSELDKYILKYEKRNIYYTVCARWHTQNYYHGELGTIYNRAQLYDLTYNKHIRLFYYIYYKNISVRGWRKA